MKRVVFVAIMLAGITVSAAALVEPRVDSEIYDVSLGCYDDTSVTLSNALGELHDVECRGDGATHCYAFSSPTCYLKQLILEDLDGGDLEDGDLVKIRGFFQFYTNKISVEGANGAPLTSSQSPQQTDDLIFEIETIDCDDCLVSESARVSLLSVSLNTFWSAAGGGSGVVNATATSRGDYEKFEITIW